MKGLQDKVWDACYSSNLLQERFLCYIKGGQPEGAKKLYMVDVLIKHYPLKVKIRILSLSFILLELLKIGIMPQLKAFLKR